MNNHIGVLLAVAGLFAAVYGAAGLPAALIVAGIVLFGASALLLIDFPDGPGGDR